MREHIKNKYLGIETGKSEECFSFPWNRKQDILVEIQNNSQAILYQFCL